MLNALYNQVDEEVHKLVILSNRSQKELESLLEVRKFEEQTEQVRFNCWCFHLCRTLHLLQLCFTLLTWPQSEKKCFLLLQIKLWFSSEGEKQLTPLDSLTLSVDKIKEMRESLEQFLEESVVNSSSVFFSSLHTSLRRHRHSELIIFLLTDPTETRPAAGERVPGFSSGFRSPRL